MTATSEVESDVQTDTASVEDRIDTESAVMKLDAIIPYWRNPRLIPEEAVSAVTASIRQYGYQQPIVVDDDGIIVVGHTRYMALRRLGYTEVRVKVARGLSATQVKQLRVLDNRTREYASWDFEKLMAELGDLDAASMAEFFPEADADPAKYRSAEPGSGWSDADKPVTDPAQWKPPVVAEVEFVCPSCYHMWEMQVTRDAVFTGLLRVDADAESSPGEREPKEATHE